MSNNDIDDLFKCFICMDEIGKPAVCPNCSKIACMVCFQKWVNAKDECPHCRSSLTITQLVKLDWATDVLEILKKTANLSENQCAKHRLSKDYWCNNCSILGCSDCFLLESDHSQHEFWKGQQLWSSRCDEIYKSQSVAYYYEQKDYWSRYLDDITRQLSDFNRECLNFKNNEEELFEAGKQSFQSAEDYSNIYYENCLKIAEAKIAMFTEALEIGDAFLNDLPLEAALKDNDGYFSQAASIVKSVVDDYDSGKNSLESLELDPPQPLPFNSIIPEYESCEFTIVDFKAFVSNSEIRMSPVTRFSGCDWRIKSYTFQSEKSSAVYFSIFLELFQGLSGEFEYKIDLLETNDEFNSSPSLSKVYRSKFRQGECWGYQKFVKLGDHFNSLYYNHTNDSISLIYHVRPRTFHQKCNQLQDYILKLEENIKTDSLDSPVSIQYSSLKPRTIKEISTESRESKDTLTEFPLNSSSTINQRIQEIETSIENTSLEETFQDTESYSSTSSMTEFSSQQGANTILSRIVNTKNK